MDETPWLAQQFETHRPHLRGVAYRMLGSLIDADDAVQECWLRVERSGTSGVENLGGWLTTAVARVCLDMLRSRRSRREQPFGVRMPEPIANRPGAAEPEHEALLADSVGLALLVILEKLGPAERVAFVLHDVFDLPFDEIAPVVGRTPAAARKLASRARRRVRGGATTQDFDLPSRRRVLEAFLDASRDGDFGALLTLLDPDVAFRADAAAVLAGAPRELRGAAQLAASFAGRAQGAQLALIDGEVGLVWAPGGTARGAFRFTIANGVILAIELIGDTERVGRLEVVLLDG
jgi:RNA polymerase sigma factor (sigma-70 family)